MKRISEALKKEQIAGSKGYVKWFRVIDGQLRLFVNENSVNKQGEKLNFIYYKENKALLCLDDITCSNDFYEKYKNYDVRVFIKFDSYTLYNEYEVKSFGICNEGLEVLFA